MDIAKKIARLINFLSDSEKEDLHQLIKSKYAVEDSRMLRDDIVSKICELIEIEFSWLMDVEENDTLEESAITSSDIAVFIPVLIEEFSLKEVNFSQQIEWKTVKDIVDYIEDHIGECDE